jgi:hypothetical protein
MMTDWENPKHVLGETSVLLPHCPQQILNNLLWKKTPASAVNSKWLTFRLNKR